MAEARLIGCLAFVDVVHTVSEHTVDELGESTCDIEDGDLAFLSPGDATETSAEGRLGAGEGKGSDPEHPGYSISPGAIGTLVELLSAGDGAARRNQETKSFSVGNRERLRPNSVRMIMAAWLLMPSMRVKSTPPKRQRSVRSG